MKNIKHYKAPSYWGLSRFSDWLWAGQLGFGASIPGRGWEFFSSPPRTDRLWDLPSLLSNGNRELFPREWSGWGV